MEDQKCESSGCDRIPPLDDLALIAALDGEASPDITAHMQTCHYCAERARNFVELQKLLHMRLYRMLCPSSDELAAFYQGLLDNERQAILAKHLDDCPHCTHELGMLAAALVVPLREPPPNKIRRVVARLLAPQPRSPLAFAYGALRGPPSGAQYAYRAENMRLMLDVEQAAGRPGRLVLVGLVAMDDAPDSAPGDAHVTLLSDDRVITSSTIDELGNFVLDNLIPGDYTLVLRLPDREVIVEALCL